MKRRVFAAVMAVASACAAPAWAHEEISPSSVPTGKPAFFTLTAANEKSADLNKVTVTAPEGLALGHATRETAGWTAGVSGTAVTWTGGAVKHDHFEQWGFEMEDADQPGTRNFKVTLGYSDDSTEDVEVPLTVVASEATGTPATPTASTAANPGAPVTAAESESQGGDDALDIAALVVALIALVTAAGAVMASRRRGPIHPAAAGDQDW